MKGHIILITGAPKTGKSTLVGLVKNRVRNYGKVGGIYCSGQKAADKVRIGFMINYFSSAHPYVLSCELARVKASESAIPSGYIEFRKYLVNSGNVRDFMIPGIKNALDCEDIIVIDEFADMQMLCDGFEQCMEKVAKTKKLVIMTISETCYNSDQDVVHKIKNSTIKTYALFSGGCLRIFCKNICSDVANFMEK